MTTSAKDARLLPQPLLHGRPDAATAKFEAPVQVLSGHGRRNWLPVIHGDRSRGRLFYSRQCQEPFARAYRARLIALNSVLLSMDATGRFLIRQMRRLHRLDQPRG